MSKHLYDFPHSYVPYSFYRFCHFLLPFLRSILLTNAFANDLFSSKGMCEQVIMNEEIENEKAIKHRKKLIGRYSIDR